MEDEIDNKEPISSRKYYDYYMKLNGYYKCFECLKTMNKIDESFCCSQCNFASYCSKICMESDAKCHDKICHKLTSIMNADIKGRTIKCDIVNRFGNIVANRDIKKGEIIYRSSIDSNMLCISFGVDRISNLRELFDRHTVKTDQIYSNVKKSNFEAFGTEEMEIKRNIWFNVCDEISMISFKQSALPKNVSIDMYDTSKPLSPHPKFLIKTKEMTPLNQITDELMFMYENHEYLMKYWIFADKIDVDLPSDNNEFSNDKIMYIVSRLPSSITSKYTIDTIKKHIRIYNYILTTKTFTMNSLFSHQRFIDNIFDVIFFFLIPSCDPNVIISMDLGELLITATENIKSSELISYNNDFMMTVFNHDFRSNMQNMSNPKNKYCKCHVCSSERLQKRYNIKQYFNDIKKRKIFIQNYSDSNPKKANIECFAKMFRMILVPMIATNGLHATLRDLYSLQNFTTIYQSKGYVTAVLAYCNPSKYKYNFLAFLDQNLLNIIKEDMTEVIGLFSGQSLFIFINALYNLTYLWCLQINYDYENIYLKGFNESNKNNAVSIHDYMIKRIESSRFYKCFRDLYEHHFFSITEWTCFKQFLNIECINDPAFTFTVRIFLQNMKKLVTTQKQ